MIVCPKVKRQVLSTRTSHCYGRIPRTVKLVAPFYDWNLFAPFLNYHFEFDCPKKQPYCVKPCIFLVYSTSLDNTKIFDLTKSTRHLLKIGCILGNNEIRCIRQFTQ